MDAPVPVMYVPGAHRRQRVVPTSNAYLPVGQTPQIASALAPVVEENVPAGQDRQLPSVLDAVPVLYFPVGHTVHVADAVAAVSNEYLPEEQA